MQGVEDVRGSRYGDLIDGNGRPNLLFGIEGDDALDGRGGKDDARGGQGGDRCSAEATEGCETPDPTLLPPLGQTPA